MENRYDSRFEYMQDYEALCSVYIRAYMERVVADKKVTQTAYEKYKGLVISYEEAGEAYSKKQKFCLTDSELDTAAGLYRTITEKAAESEVFLPLEYVGKVFELQPLEKIIIAAGYMTAFEHEYGKTYGYINDNVNRQYLTLDTVTELFADSDKLLAQWMKEKFLKYVFDMSEEAADGQVSLKPCKRVTQLLKEGSMSPGYDWSRMFYPMQEELPIVGNDEACAEIESIISKSQRLLVCIEAVKGSGRKSILKKAAEKQKHPVMFVDFTVFTDSAEDAEVIRRTDDIVRELLILQCFLCIYNIDFTRHEELLSRCIDRISRVAGVIFVCLDKGQRVASSDEQLPVYTINLKKLDRAENLLIWNSTDRPYAEDIILQEYVNKYNFTPREIKGIIRFAEERAGLTDNQVITKQLLDDSCNSLLMDAFDGRATLITQKFTLDDLILPEEQKRQLKEGLGHILYRNVVYDEWGFEEKLAYGKGLNMLFEGPPGTGKTMAAGIVGRELGLPVYKVDISRMVSKYIGETEKSLGEVFDIAARNNSILFFDEMDALFGRRSEVKDSHDRYANIETAYLLQRLEDYEGVVLMSTNFIQNVDEAFIRRINYIIQFPMPDRVMREALWRGMFTPKMPIERDIDFDYLAAQFELSGASIKSIVMSAAFIAAESKSSITMYHILRAVKKLMMKQGKIMLDGDFGRYSVYLHM